MIEIIDICHRGICTPLYACIFASYAQNPEFKVIYIDSNGFKGKGLEGIIDYSQGVSVIYRGDGDPKQIMDAVFNYIKKRKNHLIEKWHETIKNHSRSG